MTCVDITTVTLIPGAGRYAVANNLRERVVSITRAGRYAVTNNFSDFDKRRVSMVMLFRHGFYTYVTGNTPLHIVKLPNKGTHIDTAASAPAAMPISRCMAGAGGL